MTAVIESLVLWRQSKFLIDEPARGSPGGLIGAVVEIIKLVKLGIKIFRKFCFSNFSNTTTANEPADYPLDLNSSLDELMRNPKGMEYQVVFFGI